MDEPPPSLIQGSRFPFSALALVVVLTAVLSWVAFRQFDRDTTRSDLADTTAGTQTDQIARQGDSAGSLLTESAFESGPAGGTIDSAPQPLLRDAEWENQEIGAAGDFAGQSDPADQRAGAEPPIRDDGSELVPVDEPRSATRSARNPRRDPEASRTTARPAGSASSRSARSEAVTRAAAGRSAALAETARTTESTPPPVRQAPRTVVSEELPDSRQESGIASEGAGSSALGGFASPIGDRNPRDMARLGDYAGAARRWSEALEVKAGPATVTLQLSANCNTGNLDPLFRDAAGASDLFLLPVTIRGGECYRVCYGVYPNRETAQQDAGSLPGDVLRPGAVARPVPLANLLSR